MCWRCAGMCWRQIPEFGTVDLANCAVTYQYTPPPSLGGEFMANSLNQCRSTKRRCSHTLFGGHSGQSVCGCVLSVWLRVDGARNSCARRTTGARCTTSGSKIGSQSQSQSQGRLTQETIAFQVTFSILGWSLIGECELSEREDKYQNPRIPAAGSVFANANKSTGNGICRQFFCICKYGFGGFEGFDTLFIYESRHSVFGNVNAPCVSRPLALPY